MVIDFHTHIISSEFVGLEFLNEYLDQGYREAVDYLDIGPSTETWNQMLGMFRALNLDQMAAMYLQSKAEAGIDKSVIFHVDVASAPPAPMNYEEANKWFADFAHNNPDRVIAFAGIDPQRGEQGLKVFERCVKEWGMKGLKLHPVAAGYFPNDKRVYPFYAKAQELNVPVLFHTGPSGNGKMNYGNPLHVDDVAADFPKLKIIIAHLQDPWLVECMTMATWRPNVYIDISGGQVLYRTEPERFYRALKLLLRSPARKRALFATDAPSMLNFLVSDKEFVEMAKGLPDSKYASDIPVSQDALADLLSGNAKRLLGLD